MPSIAAGDLDVFWKESAPGGTPVVMIHGNWGTSSWWEPTLARVPAGLRGIALDLRGRGRTRGPDSSYAIASLAEDLASFARALELPRVHVVGHSLGSAVAMQLALDHPELVRSLVVVAPAWVDGMPAVFHDAAHQRTLASREVLGRALRPLAPAVAIDAFWERLIDEGHTQRIEAAIANLDAVTAWSPGDRLRTIAAPKLVISGALDALTGPATALRAAAALGAEHVVLPGVGHCIPIEAPDAFTDALWRFVRSAAGAHPAPTMG
jgi:pimeloyl-ACP methyl ester carboxylesterase